MKTGWSIMIAKLGLTIRKVLPPLLKGKEKAVAVWVATQIVGQTARLIPSWHVAPSVAVTQIAAIIVYTLVHMVTNVPPATK